MAFDQGAFLRALAKAGWVRRIAGQAELRIWQRRFWEHTIRDVDDLRRHVDYIHFNPAKHGLVSAVADWPHSSFHRYVARAELPRDWAGISADAGVRSFGE